MPSASRSHGRADWRRRAHGARPTTSSGTTTSGGTTEPGGLISVNVAELDQKHAQAALLRALQTHGLVVLNLPRSERLAERVDACMTAAQSFFDRAELSKAEHMAGDRPEQQHGWLMFQTGTQFFEVRQHFDGREWQWPTSPGDFRAAVTDAAALMRSAATRALAGIVAALDMDPRHVLSLLDVDAPPRDLTDASHSALRIWSYQSGTPPTAWHCDNSFLTLGAKGSCRGLHVRLLTGQLLYPEDHMTSDQLILYPGDTLSYLSGGRVLALMHEVDTPPAGAPPRLSIPYFLRARRDATLRPILASRGLEAARQLPPLSVDDLEENEGGVRQSFSWKQQRYFTEPSALTGLPPAKYGLKLSGVYR